MALTIRKMEEPDVEQVYSMMQTFYNSEHVIHHPDDEAIKNIVRACVQEFPAVQGFVLVEDSIIKGYAVVVQYFSTEVGGWALWIEDLYVKPQYQGQGIGKQFFSFIEDYAKEKYIRLRLEVEPANHNAIALYKKLGFEELHYIQFIKDKKPAKD